MNERVQGAIDAAMAAAYAWRDAVVLCVDPDAEDGDVFAIVEARHGLVKQAIENVARATRADMLARDESMETYLLYGCVEKADGTVWSEDEGRAFSERFLTWLEEQGLDYGGLLGEPMKEESMHSKRAVR